MAFYRTDSDRSKFIIESTRTFTQAVLGTDSTTYLGQTVGLMCEFRSLYDAAFTGQLEPIRNVIMDRALPLAVGVSAGNTPFRLRLALALLIGIINLTKLVPA
jgi:hypothetical protein